MHISERTVKVNSLRSGNFFEVQGVVRQIVDLKPLQGRMVEVIAADIDNPEDVVPVTMFRDNRIHLYMHDRHSAK